ncbi:hypothetical protein Cgig2_014346 [Carnegiea gigantea]|uniref:Uncharacterized protein n=1 Tax=Carnegiea gigantea TaxID=171969 RepID=A0A9Q1GHY7_9CARY|nr:hypothetical protein Cgig2_014346 [Carnegiea gigantea]
MECYKIDEARCSPARADESSIFKLPRFRQASGANGVLWIPNDALQNKNEFGYVQHELQYCVDVLQCMSDPSTRKALFDQIRNLRWRNEVMWWQQSHVNYLTYGECASGWFTKGLMEDVPAIILISLKERMCVFIRARMIWRPSLHVSSLNYSPLIIQLL